MLIFNNIKSKNNETSEEIYDNSTESKAIINNLKQTKAELDILYHNLDYVTNPILMNQLIFQLKAAEVRYQYWFCMAKDLNISNGLSII